MKKSNPESDVLLENRSIVKIVVRSLALSGKEPFPSTLVGSLAGLIKKIDISYRQKKKGNLVLYRSPLRI